MKTTTLLLADPSPSLRWRAAVELDGALDTDDEVAGWRAEIDRSDEVRGLLEQLAHSERPLMTGYLLCRLSYVGFRGPELETAVEALFDSQQTDGSWPWTDQDQDVKSKAGPKVSRSEEPRFVTMQTVLPLRGIAAAGFGTDPRAERGYDWLTGVRLPDGSWPSGPKADLGKPGKQSQAERAYRRLPRGVGCRSATAGAVACLSLHPKRNRSDAARIGVDHLLARETRDEAIIGWEVARLVGVERALGIVTFYVPLDPAFLLDLASRCGVSPEDRRVRELTDYVQALRGPYGLWQHAAHPQLSRWLSFDLESSFRRIANGDWVGDETPA